MGNFEARLERAGDLDGVMYCLRFSDHERGVPHGCNGLAPHSAPRPGDPIVLYEDRRTILAITDRGGGPLIVAEDADGFRIERRVAALVWSVDERAWR